MIDYLRRGFWVVLAVLALGLGVVACDENGSDDAASDDAATTSDDMTTDDTTTDDGG